MKRLIGLTIVILMMGVSGTARANSFFNRYFDGMYGTDYGYGYYGYGDKDVQMLGVGGTIAFQFYREDHRYKIEKKQVENEGRFIAMAEKEQNHRLRPKNQGETIYGVPVNTPISETERLKLENQRLQAEIQKLKLEKEVLELKQSQKTQ